MLQVGATGIEEEEDVTAGTMKSIIFWDVTPCSLAEVN
jgi:hypothetical protein